MSKGGKRMNYSNWASIAEIKNITEGVNLKTGVTKSGLPVMYDDKHLYIHILFL